MKDWIILVLLAVIALLLPRPDKGSEGLLICPDIGIKMPVTMYRHKGGVHYFRELEAVDFAYNGECFFRYDPFQP